MINGPAPKHPPLKYERIELEPASLKGYDPAFHAKPQDIYGDYPRWTESMFNVPEPNHWGFWVFFLTLLAAFFLGFVTARMWEPKSIQPAVQQPEANPR